ncbi:MAG: 16S rRNA (uracil1498-N3)-methyltransferase, partial [Candidatus Binatia bacterium]
MISAIVSSTRPKTRILVEPERFKEDRAIIAGPAFHHLQTVLRLNPGDELIVFNGQGREAVGIIELFQGKTAVVRVMAETNTMTESALDLTLAPCLAKGKKTDMIVEKAVELGVDRVCVVTSKRSVGKLIGDAALTRVDRWRRISVAAAEQSGRTQMPIVERIRSLEELCRSRKPDALGLMFTANAGPDPAATLRQRYPDTYKVIAVVGPEGGFAPEEIAMAESFGFQAVGLGPRVLRTETAAIVAAAICQHLWGDLGRTPA